MRADCGPRTGYRDRNRSAGAAICTGDHAGSYGYSMYYQSEDVCGFRLSTGLTPHEQMDPMKLEIGRRHFLALFGAAATSWPSSIYAQGSNDVRTIGFLMGLADDNEAKIRIAAFEQGLEKQGFIPGRNLHIEYRFSAGDAARMRTYARELVGLRPDLIVGHSTPVVTQLVQATSTIPVVFVVVADPVGSGFAASIPRPGRNVTGFTNLDITIPGKLLTLLKQIAPNIKRVALLFNPATVVRGGSAALYLRKYQEAATSFAVSATTMQVKTPEEIEESMSRLGAESGAGLIVMPDNFTAIHRKLIVSLATQWRIPAIYPYRYFVEAGGLMSYGVDVVDLFRRSSDYVARILNHANPANLPIQAPTKFELVINMKVAKSLGLDVPKILLAGASDLIE